MCLSRSERQDLLEKDNPELPIYKQCELLELNRSTIYYIHRQPSCEEIRIKHRIDEIYTEFPYYGSRRIMEQLRLENICVGRDLVRRHMKEMGISAIYPAKNLSKRNQQHKVYPYLLRGVEISRPNMAWGIDITYIRLRKGWLYMVAIIDWYSRYILSWELDQILEMYFVLDAVDRALKNAKPDIMNSDQGSHFTSPRYTGLLEREGIRISMDGKGRAIDNIIIERFFRSLKYEEVYINDYDNPRDARRGIGVYLEKYNYKRLHQSIGHRTLAEAYFKGAN